MIFQTQYHSSQKRGRQRENFSQFSGDQTNQDDDVNFNSKENGALWGDQCSDSEPSFSGDDKGDDVDQSEL